MRALLVKIFKKIHLYNITVKVLKVFEHIWYTRLNTKKTTEKIKKTAVNAANIIDEILRDVKREAVYILQHSYYTQDGQQYISGGGERYASDLAEIIYLLGYQPILVQLGKREFKEVWKNKRGNLYVLGLNVDYHLYSRVLELLPQPKLAIYSGYVDFGKNLFSPNILISHGITWDNPVLDVDTEKIKEMLLCAERLVSVDTNTLSWLRSTYANTLVKKPVEMHYVPNYTDLDIYKPNQNRNEENTVKVIFPRRCSPERGFWLISEVLPELLDKHKNLVFEFIGFVHTDDIGRKIEELKSSYPERVHHYFVKAEDMYRVYQDADISIIPTLYSEGTSLSCIEAMGCGNVVIATNIGGLTNLIIDKFNGRLINPNGQELMEALDEVIGNREERTRMSRNALEVSKTFSKVNWDERWKKILMNSMR